MEKDTDCGVCASRSEVWSCVVQFGEHLASERGPWHFRIVGQVCLQAAAAHCFCCVRYQRDAVVGDRVPHGCEWQTDGEVDPAAVMQQFGEVFEVDRTQSPRAWQFELAGVGFAFGHALCKHATAHGNDDGAGLHQSHCVPLAAHRQLGCYAESSRSAIAGHRTLPAARRARRAHHRAEFHQGLIEVAGPRAIEPLFGDCAHLYCAGFFLMSVRNARCRAATRSTLPSTAVSGRPNAIDPTAPRV